MAYSLPLLLPICSSQKEQLDKPNVLRGEHLQLDGSAITFGLLYG